MNDLTQETPPFFNYLKIFFKRKELLIIPSFIGLVLGICSGILMPKQFRSETVILVEEGKTDNPLFNKLAVSTTVGERMGAIRESMLGWNSIVKLVKRLNLDQDVKTTREFESLIIRIRDSVKIRLKGQNVIYLSYVSADPVLTQAVVQNIADIFIERNQEIQDRETADAIVFIQEQLKVYKGKVLSAEIAQMQEQLDNFLIDSTEKHPVVKALREKIDKKMSQLKEENLAFTKADRIKSESNSILIENIKSALSNLEGKTSQPAESLEGSTEGVVTPTTDSDVAKVLLIEKMDNVLARDAGVNSQIYNMLLQRLETAKITQRLQSSKEGTRYNIIEPPRIPLAPFKPNRMLVALVGLFMGIVAGVSMVLVTIFFDKSFIDVEEAKEFLGVPLLGAISKIETEDTIQQEHERSRWIYSLTFVVGIAIIVVTVTVSNFLK